MRIAPGVLLLVGGWITIWSTTWFLNPLAFTVLWTGAASVMWTVSDRYPGPARHLALAMISVPFWWYFEAINRRTENWEYAGREQYTDLEYAVMASLAFATVVPALVAAAKLSERVFSRWPSRNATTISASSRTAAALIGMGLATEGAVLIYPVALFPFVWIAPFFVVDGVMILAGGSSISVELSHGKFRRAMIVGASGLLCGLLWEFWNFWAFPKWTYDIPLLDFVPIFEMPILGYGGYVPFAWTVVQLVALLDRWNRRPDMLPSTVS